MTKEGGAKTRNRSDVAAEIEVELVVEGLRQSMVSP
jgi:hypothetical protein